MHRLGKYTASDRMSDLVCGNYHILLIMSRFGIALGFGDRTVDEVCCQSGVDTATFLAVVNLLYDEGTTTVDCRNVSLVHPKQQKSRFPSSHFPLLYQR